MDKQLLNLTCKQLRDEIAAGRITSQQAVKNTLAAIEQINPKINAYTTVFRDAALKTAQAVDAKIAAGQSVGPLAGVPVAVKDNICTDFGTTTCSSKILQNFHSPYNATVAEKLLAADAVIIGKTNLDEFAMGSSTENSAFKPTRNPHNTDCVPGGSSGGSAAAVAAQLCYAALGSDTGGSIRQPASLCGVVGFKPTYGTVSRFGRVAYGSSLDQIGPLTKDITDTALIMNVIAGHDPKDSTSLDKSFAPGCDYLQNIDQPIENLKIAIVPEFIASADTATENAVLAAIETYKNLGAKIIEVSMPHFDYAVATYYIVATAEASANLARYDGIHYGYRTAEPADLLEAYSKSRAQALGDEVKRRIMLGTYVLSSGYYDAYYLKALKVRNLIRQDFQRCFEKADVLMMPVSPTTAFKFGEKTADPLQMYLSDIYTIAANLAGVPGLSVPCGFDKNNLPIGLQITSPNFSESKIIRTARMLEKQTDFHKHRLELDQI